MPNSVDHALTRALTSYASECEAQGVSINTAERDARLQRVVASFPAVEVLASDYWGSLPVGTALEVLRGSVLALAGIEPETEDDDKPSRKGKKAKHKEAE